MKNPKSVSALILGLNDGGCAEICIVRQHRFFACNRKDVYRCPKRLRPDLKTISFLASLNSSEMDLSMAPTSSVSDHGCFCDTEITK
jgi:hypothetical protein